tara:strand:+ start:270 stop:554 length:285 start_codon:yes stop_codon:yes gene_type:complete
MPQAAADLSDRINARFGSIDDSGPMKFLTDAGYRLRRDFFWEAKPGVTSNSDMTDDEWECLLFLVQEWDFGGLASPTDPACPVLSTDEKSSNGS